MKKKRASKSQWKWYFLMIQMKLLKEKDYAKRNPPVCLYILPPSIYPPWFLPKFFVEFSKFREVFEDDFKSIRISRNSYGTPYDFIKKHQNVWKNHMVNPMIFLELLKYWKNHMVPPMIFLELSKYGKKHMIPPMIFDKTNQQYNIFVWYSLKNIQINFSKYLYHVG